MFNFGKAKLPANWPPLHHKCNRSKCTFPNYPQPAPGTYKCRGCEKGNYSVSPAQAKEVDAQNRKVFYIPGRSPPLNVRRQPQSWDLNQEFPTSARVGGPRQTFHTDVHTIARKVVQAPTSRHGPHRAVMGDPSIRNAHAVYPSGLKTTTRQIYASSDHTLVSNKDPQSDRVGYIPVRAERRPERPYRVVNI
ncbi:hypothetical protein EV359DRAFT_76983 [Lentinula novae-zelandiae]|nr:hypothetical protein EV359DRAFT_76983 [Lentinula novae-zelandiae]